MSVTETSKKAYRELKDLGQKQRDVYEAVKGMEKFDLPCAQDVADKLEVPVNRITGRIKELRDYGFLKVHGKKVSRYGTTVNTLCTASPQDEKLIDLTSDPADDLKEDKWQPAATGWMYD